MTEFLSIANKQKPQKGLRYFEDDIFFDFYSDYYNNLSSKDLDKDFNHELNVLVQAMSKLNDVEKKAFINLLSIVIEHYLEQKIDKEIDISFKKILKL
jgi:hypothetical protein